MTVKRGALRLMLWSFQTASGSLSGTVQLARQTSGLMNSAAILWHAYFIRTGSRVGVRRDAVGHDVRGKRPCTGIDVARSSDGGPLRTSPGPVSYTHLTLPTTPYV